MAKKKSIDATTRVVRKPGFAACDLAGQSVLLDTSKGVYHGLNGVGSHLWSLLLAPIAVASLCDSVVSEYDVDPDTCLADVLVLLEDLRTAELIEVLDGELS